MLVLHFLGDKEASLSVWSSRLREESKLQGDVKTSQSMACSWDAIEVSTAGESNRKAGTFSEAWSTETEAVGLNQMPSCNCSHSRSS